MSQLTVGNVNNLTIGRFELSLFINVQPEKLAWLILLTIAAARVHGNFSIYF